MTKIQKGTMLYVTDAPELDEPQNHNYFKGVQDVGKGIIGKPGVYHVNVYHDDWCNIFSDSGGYCNCNPDVGTKKGYSTRKYLTEKIEPN